MWSVNEMSDQPPCVGYAHTLPVPHFALRNIQNSWGYEPADDSAGIITPGVGGHNLSFSSDIGTISMAATRDP